MTADSSLPPHPAPPLRLGQMLVQARIITDALLQDALIRAGQTGQRLGETLVPWGRPPRRTC